MAEKGGIIDARASGDEVDEAKPSTSTNESAEGASGFSSGHLIEKTVMESDEEGATGGYASYIIDIKIIFNKKKFDIVLPLSATIWDLKEVTAGLIGVPPELQKVMYKGMAKDHQTLDELKVTSGSKIMVVGSTMKDIMEAAVKPPERDLIDFKPSPPPIVKEPWCRQKKHKRVLEKFGKPEEAIKGVEGIHEALPQMTLTGMYNYMGSKVRLTFKLETNQLWIITKEKTEKVAMHSIKDVVSEPIEDHEEYVITAIQMGPTEESRLFIYWVPAQYHKAIRDIILGKWMCF